MPLRRGVKVTALIAYVNRGGTDSLRKLELRFLEAGIIVARTAGDLIRYHDKFILIDRRVLYVLSFNFTHLDIDHSRGFGIVTTNRAWVREGMKLIQSRLHAHLVQGGSRNVCRQSGEFAGGAWHVSEASQDPIIDLRS